MALWVRHLFICLCLDQLGNQVISTLGHQATESSEVTEQPTVSIVCATVKTALLLPSPLFSSLLGTPLIVSLRQIPSCQDRIIHFHFPALRPWGREATNSSPGFPLKESSPQECAAYESVGYGQRRLVHFYPLLD